MVRLQEEIVGNYAITYHGTSHPEIVLNEKFIAGKGQGSTYGEGIYSVYELEHSPTKRGNYGSTIIKLAVSMGNILNIDGCYHPYGGKGDKITTWTFSQESFQQELDRIRFPKGLTETLRENFWTMGHAGPNAKPITADVALAISKLPALKNTLHGIAYTGNHDGRCVVVYTFDNYLPLATSIDHGKSWQKVGDNDFLKKQARTFLDYNASVNLLPRAASASINLIAKVAADIQKKTISLEVAEARLISAVGKAESLKLSNLRTEDLEWIFENRMSKLLIAILKQEPDKVASIIKFGGGESDELSSVAEKKRAQDKNYTFVRNRLIAAFPSKNVKQTEAFLREMESSGISASAPENMLKLIAPLTTNYESEIKEENNGQ